MIVNHSFAKIVSVLFFFEFAGIAINSANTVICHVIYLRFLGFYVLTFL